MNAFMNKLQIGFYENELIQNIIPFWMERCEDKEYGGYLCCFSNDNKALLSTVKYTWSQGRALWLFSHLSRMERTFKSAQRKEFLRMAKVGRDYIVNHCFLSDKPLRCIFLTDQKGNPLHVPGYDNYDVSESADVFAIIGLTEYAIAASDKETYDIVKELYISATERAESFNFGSYPYPTSEVYLQHGYYMSWILRNYCITKAAAVFEPEFAKHTKAKLKEGMDSLLRYFVDENDVLREVRHRDAQRTAVPGAFGNHSNPGHVVEEMWFIQHSADLLGDASYTEKLAKIVKKALHLGWDTTYGGLYHFCSTQGGPPIATPDDPVDEPTFQQLMDGWGDKLWWVHSEALYSTLLFGLRLNDEELLSWHQKVFEYTFKTYPNPDREVREWVQIRTREGLPQQKVTSLPVKDPFHIARDLIYILELLYRQEG